MLNFSDTCPPAQVASTGPEMLPETETQTPTSASTAPVIGIASITPIPLPVHLFQGYGGKLTPRTLRVVKTGVLLYIVREGYEAQDGALLDSALELQGGPLVRSIQLEDGGTVKQWDFLESGVIVELVAVTKLPKETTETQEGSKSNA